MRWHERADIISQMRELIVHQNDEGFRNWGTIAAELSRTYGETLTKEAVRHYYRANPQDFQSLPTGRSAFPDKQIADGDPWTLLKRVVDLQGEYKRYEYGQGAATVDMARLLDKPQPFAVMLQSDFHLESEYTDIEAFTSHINLLKEEQGLFACWLGDYLDNFGGSKFKDGLFHYVMTPDMGKRVLTQIIEDCAAKLLATTLGNHDRWTDKADGTDIGWLLFSKVRFPVLSDGGTLHIKAWGQQYTLHVRHQYRYNSSMNLTHTVKRMHEHEGPFDIGVVAHHHDPAIEVAHVQDKPTILVRTGSYKTRDRYSAQLGFHPRVGVPTIVLYPDRHEMVPFMDPLAACRFLRAEKGG